MIYFDRPINQTIKINTCYLKETDLLGKYYKETNAMQMSGKPQIMPISQWFITRFKITFQPLGLPHLFIHKILLWLWYHIAFYSWQCPFSTARIENV